MKLLKLLSCIILLSIFAHAAHAAPLSQAVYEDGQIYGEIYIVQSGDWLMKIAQSFYGEGVGYADIIAATNRKAQTDPSFVTISDPGKECLAG